MSKVLLIPAAIMALASAMMLYSVVEYRAVLRLHPEFRAALRLDPELQRLAIDYLRAEEQRREYGRKVDAANRAAEQNFKLPIDELSRVSPTFDLSPKASPHVKPLK